MQVLNNSVSISQLESVAGPESSNTHLNSLQVPASPQNSDLDGKTLRSRSSSFISNASTARSRAVSDARISSSRYEGDDVTLEEIFRPDKLSESDFEVLDNPFAFSPGQLNKLLNPKSLAAFRALGGIKGLETGLKTDIRSGLSVDETSIFSSINFREATNVMPAGKHMDDETPSQSSIGNISRDTSMQYSDRIRVFKDNRLPPKKSLSIWRLFWNAFNDKVLIILTVAAGISLALGIYEAVGQPRAPGEPQSLDWVEGLAILIAVVIVVLVTGLNDYKREKQFVILNSKKDDRQVKVLRSGKSIQISVFDVVVGDVVHLESGDSIPADGILIGGHGIRCDESSATGESDAIRKFPGGEVWKGLKEGNATSKMDPFIISGSKVLEGVGTYVVTSVGINSSYGKILLSLQGENDETPLQAKLARMATWIGYAGTAAAGLLFVILLLRFLAGLSDNLDSPARKASIFLNILIVAITIIVVAVPEGLPVAVTLALSFATRRLLKENNLVRNLRACETMGNATTICSDKTGTLTQNKMTVVAGTFGPDINFARDNQLDLDDGSETMSFRSAWGRLSPSIKDLFIKSFALNSTAFEGEQDGKSTFIGSKTETALLDLAKEHLGMASVAEQRASTRIVQLVPFDSHRKCMGVIIQLPSGGNRLLVKGAAEIMLAKATRLIDDTASDKMHEKVLTEHARNDISSKITDFAEHSLRTIGILYRDFDQAWPPRGVRTTEEGKTLANFEDIFRDMTLLGIVGLQDPLRVEVPRAVKRCQEAGIMVRMVTGDSIITATAIATQCGIFTGKGTVMEGPEFRQLSDEEMDRVLPTLQVLARSSPEDKRILVARLKHLGETVAVTGDGTNDAPALKAADIGFSMGIAGTEVAKEASSIILLDDNFSSIVSAIMWGRSVNDAVSKFLQFQLTVNITAVILAFVSAVASSNFQSVLSAVQLLWVNLIMDTFAALALATDAPTEKILDRKPTPRRAALITTTMWKMILGQAVYQLIITFVLYFAGARILNYDTILNPDLQTELNTIVFNTFVWMQIFNEFNNRRLDNRLNIFEGVHRNYFFIAINVVMVAGQIMIIFVGGQAFQIKRISGSQWAVSIICALPCLLWAIILRYIPDEDAAVVFRFVGHVCLGLYRPINKTVLAVCQPFGKAWTSMSEAIFLPTKRATKRLLYALFRRSRDTPRVSPTDEELAIIMPESMPAIGRTSTPPIVLT